jgi:hypothetical protein
MIVMRIAMTPSLNASIRRLVTGGPAQSNQEAFIAGMIVSP